MGTRASVLSVNKDGTLQLQAGILKITAKQDEVRVVEGETQSQKEARRIVQRAQHTLRAAAAPSEIDLRGMMTDEAIAVLDRFLDTAMMGKLESVTIIPWKGDRRGAQGGAGAFEAQPLYQILPPRPLRRGGGRRHRGGAAVRGRALFPRGTEARTAGPAVGGDREEGHLPPNAVDLPQFLLRKEGRFVKNVIDGCGMNLVC